MAQKADKKDFSSASSQRNAGASRMKQLLITLCVTIVVLGGIILLYLFLPAVTNKADNDALIKIPLNASNEMVNDSISKYLGDKYASKVMLMSKVRRSDFSKRHGAFMIEKGTSPLRAERKLISGSQYPMNVTVNSARGLDKVSERIASRLDVAPDSLLNFLQQPGNLDAYGLSPDDALALFIDDTHQFFWNASPKTIVEKFGANYKKIWNDERLKKAASLGLSPAQVITLASIVDEETNKADEKPLVARLYLNRLKKGMKLQADPTVKFALGDFSLRRIRTHHLSIDSPYNTYKISGLPPGPIRSVSVKDIDAVLDAPLHNYIYMCAKEDFSGYHNFAADYNTHQQNARKYQRALNQKKIF